MCVILFLFAKNLTIEQVPTDVDVRVMLTFLELYQTLLSFVFFKLYTDAGFVYPPPLDMKKDGDGAGVDALNLQATTRPLPVQPSKTVTIEGRQISARDVRQTIKRINAGTEEGTPEVEMTEPTTIATEIATEIDEDFIVPPSSSSKEVTASLPTLQTLSTLPQSLNANLFTPYTFWLSRETSRSIFEFVVRSFGGRIGWPASSGSSSPFNEGDPSITHVIIDRPLVEKKEEDSAQRELRARRKHVQPQWVIDCINAGKILLEGPYEQGKTLPPHLSPFGEYEGAYIPSEALDEQKSDEVDGEKVDSQDEENSVDEDVVDAVESQDPTALRAAELAAEAAGLEHGEFEAKIKQAGHERRKKSEDRVQTAEQDMNKMLMSNKQRKLYEKMKYSQRRKNEEVRDPDVLLTLWTDVYHFSG
jgi:pescadillo protein